MADPKLVELLNQGSEVWNRWRAKQPVISRIDLRQANLSGADLSHADLNRVSLNEANLRIVHLEGANLQEALLNDTDLRDAHLCDADLRDANLTRADLSEADLARTNLSYADLPRANLRSANLSGANLRGTVILDTIFASVDLRMVKGLAEINHMGPSLVDLRTVQLPQDGSALHFLRGTGMPDEWIDFYRATMMNPIQYHSCFISYSSNDNTFAPRLHADLQAQGVRCWFAPHDMKTGDKIRPIISEAIHLQDKLLLILSENSIVSDWVEHEVETALARERKEKRPILFPIRLDNAILEQEYTGWAALVQHERHIGDFTNWTDPQAYELVGQLPSPVRLVFASYSL